MKQVSTGVKYRLNCVGVKVEELGLYGTESERTENRTMYVLGSDEIALINSGGAIRMGLEDILKVCEEVPEIIRDFNTHARHNRKNSSMKNLFMKKGDGSDGKNEKHGSSI